MSVNIYDKVNDGLIPVAGRLSDDKVSKFNVLHTVEECQASTSPLDVAGASAVKELLEDTETFLTGAPYNAVFRRVGKVVQFQILSQVIASYTSNTVLFTVPSSFIPNKTSDTFICYVFDTSNTYRGIGKINSSGGFSFNNGVSDAALRVVGSYVIQ